MATETYTYFQPDPNLRAAYGGGAPQNFGDSKEIYPRDLTLRWVSKRLGRPANGTRYLWEVGMASGVVWFKVPDLHYAVVSPELSAAELATVQTTAPTGYTRQSNSGVLQPDGDRISLVVRGDSISDGVATTSGKANDTWYAQAINLMSGETIVWDDTTNYLEGRSKSFRVSNLSLGSSSWDNSVGSPDAGDANKATVYPRREAAAFNQRTKTLPLFGSRMKFLYWLGTNDGAYDPSVTGADIWARAVARINAFRAEFPNTPLALMTLIKRDESASLNNRLSDFNNLLRANAASMNLTVFDPEAKVPQMNMVTGNTLDTTYYADKIHPTTAGNGLMAAALKNDLETWLRA